MHVGGPAGAGKTRFVEWLVQSWHGFALCVRGEREPGLKRAKETAPKQHPELQRYRAAGAVLVSHYRFDEPDMDAFFQCAAMQDYSDLVVIEGECPIDSVDCRAFVAPPLPAGQSLLRRVPRGRTVALRRTSGVGSFADMVKLLFREAFGTAEDALPNLIAAANARRRAADPSQEAWVLADGYSGIERAQVVVVNVRRENRRAAAEAVLADVARLRSDRAVFDDVIGIGGNRVQVTAVAANLGKPRDAGLAKAIAKVVRVAKRARA
ncbi:MAG: hypothetical protein FJ265_06155 [Planctomycetes bacterium]|nr:hypothetical protein [Planctomycetota bacterium]